MNSTELAEYIAENAFRDKKDLSGAPYIDHLKRVASKFGTPWIKEAAFLHDLIEDCPEWSIEILRQLFNENVVNLVDLLTKKTDNYFDYIRVIKTDYDAVIVKLADLEDNMNILRFKDKPELSDNHLERLRKYHRAYYILTHDDK